MEHYILKLDSNDSEDIPIAKMGNKIISLHKSKLFDKYKTEIRGDNIEPLPYIPEDQNLRYFIGGQSGCGKSTLTAMILKNYLKLYPKQEIFVFSSLDSDPIFEGDKLLKSKIHRVDITDLENIDAENFKNSICVFDDATLPGKNLQKQIDALQDQINKKGRHYQIDIINVVDKFLEGAKTNRKFLHATYIGYFVHTGGNLAELKYMFEKKIGLDKRHVNDVLSGNSRWSLFHKQYPNFIIEQNRVKLI